MSELASSKESTDPEYTRQIITIRKSVYEVLRETAFSDPKRRLKIGDVIEAFYELALKHAGYEKINIELELLRQNSRKPGRRAQALKRLAALSPEQRAELEAWLDKQEKKT